MRRATLRRTIPGLCLAVWIFSCSRAEDGPKAPDPAGTATRTSARGGTSGETGEASLHIDPDALRDLRITTVRVEPHAHAEAIEGLAEVRVDETAYAEVGTPIEAKVARLLASPGDRVEAGTVLAELRSVELGRARASVVGARRRSELARETAERLRGLAESRLATAQERSDAEATAAGAEAALRSAEAYLHALGIATGESAEPADLSRFPVVSPVAGTVLERRAVLGGSAGPEQALFRVADLRRVWLVIEVFERDAARLSAGAPVRARFVAHPGREFSGTLEFLGTEVDPVARVVHVRAALPNEEGLLRPGMAATARISLEGKGGQVLTVPAAAVQRVEEHWCVFVPRGEGEFEMRRIARGRDLGGEVEVLEGIAPGTEVVVQGSFVLKAQMAKAHGGGEHGHH